MSNGTDIAAEVLAGLTEAGEGTGDGPLKCVLRKIGTGETPWDDQSNPDQDFEVTAVQTKRIERDGTGQIKRIMRVLLIDATGPVVEKGDLVAVDVTLSELTDSTKFNRIGHVLTTAPGGVPVLYKADLDD